MKLQFDITKMKAIGLFNNIVNIVDAGHGQETKGKRSPDSKNDGDRLCDIKENHINESILRKVTMLLDMVDAEYHLTAPEWFDATLNERCARENKIAMDAKLKRHLHTVFISIHNNAFGDGKTFNNARGTETYSFGSYYGKMFASILHMYVRMRIEDYLPDRGTKVKSFQMLRKTKSTAALLELAFMTNELDMKLLEDDRFLNKCALGIFEGLVVWAAFWKITDEGKEDDFVSNPEYISDCIDNWFDDIQLV